jgi:hypothetical protein
LWVESVVEGFRAESPAGFGDHHMRVVGRYAMYSQETTSTSLTRV